MEVADICDYLCGDGGEILASVADRTATVKSVLSHYLLTGIHDVTKKQRGCQHVKTLCSKAARMDVMTLLET